ncbi:MAG: hypothetical protein EPN91_02205 [Salinibacterium sp.]|nr:MAG: hypothetical protein EPN91_02205 [Salinibacterium sp.]
MSGRTLVRLGSNLLVDPTTIHFIRQGDGPTKFVVYHHDHATLIEAESIDEIKRQLSPPPPPPPAEIPTSLMIAYIVVATLLLGAIAAIASGVLFR